MVGDERACAFTGGLSDTALAAGNLSDDVYTDASWTDGRETGDRDKATIALMPRPKLCDRSGAARRGRNASETQSTISGPDRTREARWGLTRRRLGERITVPQKEEDPRGWGSLARSAVVVRWKIEKDSQRIRPAQ
ncbi:hypothetical protein MTO96_011889 [Rhipicephalus appendiculatus]